MANLDQITELLVQQHLGQIGLVHDVARESFGLPVVAVQDWHSFLQVVTAYYTHHVGRTTGSTMPLEIATSKAQEVVEKCFKDGVEEAFTMALSGVNGGLKRVIDKMGERLKQRMLDDLSTHVHSCMYDPYSWNDAVDLSRQFIQKYGSFLPLNTPVSVGSVASQIRDHIDVLAKNVSEIRKTFFQGVRAGAQEAREMENVRSVDMMPGNLLLAGPLQPPEPRARKTLSALFLLFLAGWLSVTVLPVGVRYWLVFDVACRFFSSAAIWGTAEYIIVGAVLGVGFLVSSPLGWSERFSRLGMLVMAWSVVFSIATLF